MRKRIPLSACQTIASVGTGRREKGATSTTSPSGIWRTPLPVKKAGGDTGATGERGGARRGEQGGAQQGATRVASQVAHEDGDEDAGGEEDVERQPPGEEVVEDREPAEEQGGEGQVGVDAAGGQGRGHGAEEEERRGARSAPG